MNSTPHKTVADFDERITDIVEDKEAVRRRIQELQEELADLEEREGLLIALRREAKRREESLSLLAPSLEKDITADRNMYQGICKLSDTPERVNLLNAFLKDINSNFEFVSWDKESTPHVPIIGIHVPWLDFTNEFIIDVNRLARIIATDETVSFIITNPGAVISPERPAKLILSGDSFQYAIADFGSCEQGEFSPEPLAQVLENGPSASSNQW